MSPSIYESNTAPPNGSTAKPSLKEATTALSNSWTAPSPAANDFRSDTLTTPTASMLAAITTCTLSDDVYSEDDTTNSLQSHIASLTTHDAGLLVMSGTMGNQVAIRAHLTHPPHSVLCDARCHIANYEAGGISTLSGAHLICVAPSNGHHLTLEDIRRHAVVSDDPHACPTSVISLENTLNGTVMPLDEVRRISAWARSEGIKLHLDGARIWEAVAAGHGTLSEYGECFDSMQLCFSKGLGAPLGSIVVGSHGFVKQARRIRKMMGGGTRQAGIISAAARVAVEEGFGKGVTGEGGRLGVSHERARSVGKRWEEKGGKLLFPVETNMVWLDLEALGLEDSDVTAIAEEEGVVLRGRRIVIHWQISEDAMTRLERVVDRVHDLGVERMKTKST